MPRPSAPARRREKFGKGSIDGLIAAETGDNAAIPGALIPALALGIPGSAPAAVLMAAMIIHGAQPGPMLMVNQPQFVYDVVGITLVATLGDPGVRAGAGAAASCGCCACRATIIMPIVFVLCVLGSYSITQRLFDVWVMLGVGIACFLLRRRGFPVAPFVLGLVLGDIVDKSLRRGLVLSDGSLLPFFTRPISAALAALVLVMLLTQIPAGAALVHAEEQDMIERLALCNEVLAPLELRRSSAPTPPSSATARWRSRPSRWPTTR